MTSGILPNVSFLGQNWVVNSATSARLRTGRLRNNQVKKPNKGGDNSAVTRVKDVRPFGCVFEDTAPPTSSSILRKGTKALGPILDEYDAQKLHCVKQTSEKIKVHRLVNYKSKFFISAVPTL